MDIAKLLNGEETVLLIDDVLEIPKTYYDNTEIVKLDKVKVKGKLTYDASDILILEAKVEGVMLLPDAVTLEPVSYHFSFEISENVYEKLEKDKFSLDIIAILWENIVLEIPIRYSEVTNYDNLKGDGWRVISEDEKVNSTNNPFKDLLNKLDEE